MTANETKLRESIDEEEFIRMDLKRTIHTSICKGDKKNDCKRINAETDIQKRCPEGSNELRILKA